MLRECKFCQSLYAWLAFIIKAGTFFLLDMNIAFASAGCDQANAGGYDVTTPLSGISALNFNDNFDAGDVLHFSTNANTLLVSLLNVNSGLNVIAGVGALSTNLTISTTQNYQFTGTLSASLFKTASLTVRCTAAPVDPPADPEDPPADPEDPPADPEDPPADPEDPPADPEDPPADPEDPPADPEDPPADPEDPPADPEDPPADPEDPPADPEDPPDSPKKPAKIDGRIKTAITNRLASALIFRGSLFSDDLQEPESKISERSASFFQNRIENYQAQLETYNKALALTSHRKNIRARMRILKHRIKLLKRALNGSSQDNVTTARLAPTPINANTPAALPQNRLSQGANTGSETDIFDLRYSKGLQKPGNAVFSSSAQIQHFSSKQADKFNGRSFTHTYTVTQKLSNWVSSQAFVQLRHGKAGLTDEANLPNQKSDIHAHFYGLGARVLLRLDPALSLQLSSLYEQGFGKIQFGEDTSKLNMQTAKLGARVQGSYSSGNWSLRPSASIIYSHFTRSRSRDSAGATLSAERQQSAGVTFGPELQYSFVLFLEHDVMTLQPFANVQGGWNFLNTQSGHDATGFAPSKNEVVLNYGAGLRIAIPRKFAFTMQGNLSDWRTGSGLTLNTQITLPILSGSHREKGQFQINTIAATGGTFQGNFRARFPINAR